MATLKYCRINLSKTNYDMSDLGSNVSGSVMKNSERRSQIPRINEIYKEYCTYKKFESVMPLFYSQLTDMDSDIIQYYDINNTKSSYFIGWSLIKLHDTKNAEALQFAWEYRNPRLNLGIASLKYECALYKSRGFEYLYLGQADEYKSQIDGYEELGPI